MHAPRNNLAFTRFLRGVLTILLDPMGRLAAGCLLQASQRHVAARRPRSLTRATAQPTVVDFSVAREAPVL
ncbi:hypothetical protein OH77DRAFT_1047597 [Trametes cingulata]|nr:hypothetical protein OH77DRAFT_1047597 [Trametes cingulata]